MLSVRKGRLEQMVNHGTGWVRMEYLVPARALVGFRTEFLTETRGTGLLHQVFEQLRAVVRRAAHSYRPARSSADRRGMTTAYSLMSLQERGELFIGPGVEVYEGMIVGENARADDIDVNPTKEKKLTNHRAAGSDDLVRLAPPRPLSLEHALETIAPDEWWRRRRRPSASARPSSTRRSGAASRSEPASPLDASLTVVGRVERRILK